MFPLFISACTCSKTEPVVNTEVEYWVPPETVHIKPSGDIYLHQNDGGMSDNDALNRYALELKAENDIFKTSYENFIIWLEEVKRIARDKGYSVKVIEPPPEPENRESP